MGIWAEIKYALNSTLGTGGVKSLDRLIYNNLTGGIQTFTENGTFTVPEGIEGIYITACGGGGGGSLGYQQSSYGGGGGAAIVAKFFKVTPGQNITISVGEGGAGAVETSSSDKALSGGNGTATIIGNLITLNGGSGGSSYISGSNFNGGSSGGTGGGNGGSSGEYNGGYGECGILGSGGKGKHGAGDYLPCGGGGSLGSGGNASEAALGYGGGGGSGTRTAGAGGNGIVVIAWGVGGYEQLIRKSYEFGRENAAVEAIGGIRRRVEVDSTSGTIYFTEFSRCKNKIQNNTGGTLTLEASTYYEDGIWKLSKPTGGEIIEYW